MTSIATKVSAVCIFSPHAVTVLRSPELTLQCIQNIFLHFAIVTSSLLVFDIVVLDILPTAKAWGENVNLDVFHRRIGNQFM